MPVTVQSLAGTSCCREGHTAERDDKAPRGTGGKVATVSDGVCPGRGARRCVHRFCPERGGEQSIARKVGLTLNFGASTREACCPGQVVVRPRALIRLSSTRRLRKGVR